jgi:hypothetical protein
MFRICTLALLCASVLLVVAGCALSPEHIAAQREANNAADDAQCRQYGAAPGSDAYVACRTNAANNRLAAALALRQAGTDVMQQGFQTMATPPPSAQPAPPADHVCIAANNTFYRC